MSRLQAGRPELVIEWTFSWVVLSSITRHSPVCSTLGRTECQSRSTAADFYAVQCLKSFSPGVFQEGFVKITLWLGCCLVALGSRRCPPAHPEAQRRKVFGMHPSKGRKKLDRLWCFIESVIYTCSKQLTRWFGLPHCECWRWNLSLGRCYCYSRQIKHTTSYLATAGRQLQDPLWATVHQLSERFHI